MKQDKHQPHVFLELDQMPVSPPLGARGAGGPFVPPATPAGHSTACGICGAPKTDRVHLDGEAAADAESPKWG
jgi:hypothetical protein